MITTKMTRVVAHNFLDDKDNGSSEVVFDQNQLRHGRTRQSAIAVWMTMLADREHSGLFFWTSA